MGRVTEAGEGNFRVKQHHMPIAPTNAGPHAPTHSPSCSSPHLMRSSTSVSHGGPSWVARMSPLADAARSY